MTGAQRLGAQIDVDSWFGQSAFTMAQLVDARPLVGDTDGPVAGR
jgi:hypothetical protein